MIFSWSSQAAPQQYKINKLYGLFILYCLRFALSLDKTGCTSTIQNKQTLWFVYFVLSSVCTIFAKKYTDKK